MIRRWGRPAVACAAVLLAGLAGCQPAPSQVDIRQAAIDARWTLRKATEDPDPFTRAKAMEALAETVGREAGPIFVKTLKDPSPAVRFAAAMGIGEVQYPPAKPLLLELSKRGEGGEPDKRVFCAIIYGLHRLGDDAATSELGSLLFDEEKEVRANAALVMGKMGVPAALAPLRILENDERTRDGMVRMNALEAMARLGDERAIGYLEGFSKLPILDLRLMAIQALGSAKSSRSRLVLMPLLNDHHPRVRVAAAGALAELGAATDRGYENCRRALEAPRGELKAAYGAGTEITDTDVSLLQELAAKAVGGMNRPAAVELLRPLLQSSSGGVRVAAAMSALQLLKQHPLEPPAPSEEPPAGTSVRQAAPPPAEASGP